MLDVTQRRILIVGGGAVAVRKASGLLHAGATSIRCVAPQIAPEMPPSVERVQREFRDSDIDGAAVVFAATDSPQVNLRILQQARQSILGSA